MKLRKLLRSDLDRAAQLDRLCFPPDIAFPRDLFEECVEHPDCQCRAMDGEEELAAFYVLHRRGSHVSQIITIDVHPEHRRKGIADLLMEDIMKTAAEGGITRIILQVAIDNAPAISLYEKWGFVRKSLLPDYYGPGLDAYLMDRIEENAS